VDPAQAVPVSVKVGDDVTGIDVTLELVHTTGITGAVVSPDGRLPNVHLSLVQGGPSLPTGFAGPVLEKSPSADGRFRFSNVTPGAYTIIASTIPLSPSGEGRQASGAYVWAKADVEVRGDEVPDVTLTLRPALRWSGRLVFEGTTLKPPLDFRGLHLSLSAVTTPNTRDVSAIATALRETGIRADGTFELTGIIPGTFGLSVTAPNADGWWLRSAVAGGNDVLDTLLEVKPDAVQIPDVVVRFSDQDASLSGAVQTATGQSAADYFIVIFPSDPAMWRPESRRVRTTRAGTDSIYTFRGLPPGDYRISALRDFDSDDLLDPSFFQTLRNTSIAVSLHDGEHKELGLRVAR
jgi:hypothetical protein